MCNWLIKFKDNVWITVYCETKDEAIQLSQVIEDHAGLSFDHEIICLGTGQ